MNECLYCGFWDSDYEGCTCFSIDKWYACPLEAKLTDAEVDKWFEPTEQNIIQARGAGH